MKWYIVFLYGVKQEDLQRVERFIVTIGIKSSENSQWGLINANNLNTEFHSLFNHSTEAGVECSVMLTVFIILQQILRLVVIAFLSCINEWQCSSKPGMGWIYILVG